MDRSTGVFKGQRRQSAAEERHLPFHRLGEAHIPSASHPRAARLLRVLRRRADTGLRALESRAGEPVTMTIPVLEGDALAAVNHRGTHVQIIAAAGSGKTEVVSQRVAALLAEGVPPSA